jgi:hypothetical protein
MKRCFFAIGLVYLFFSGVFAGPVATTNEEQFDIESTTSVHRSVNRNTNTQQNSAKADFTGISDKDFDI